MLRSLVFFSGAAALVYEVVWSRQLTTFLGITTHAHTVVLASFMAGLAFGARFFGRRADLSADPLRLFARLEGGIALYGLATLALMPGLQRLYVALAPAAGGDLSGAVLRLLLAVVALLLPTSLMGGTLPALVRALAPQPDRLQANVATLYGLNTLGAACGALASTYLLLPRLGGRGSVVVAVLLNLLVVAAAQAARRGRSLPPQPKAPPIAATVALSRWRLLLFAFGLSGAAALALQLAWIRSLTQVIGSSVYAFGLTTATYLLGLGLGSLLAFAAAGRLAAAGAILRVAAALAAAIALSVIAGLPILGRAPEIFLIGYDLGGRSTFFSVQLLGFMLAATVLLLPTICLGMLFPLLSSLGPRRATETGYGVGLAFAVNSAGTVAGTLVAGLLLIPALGAGGLLRAAAVTCAAVAVLLWSIDADGRRLAPGPVGFVLVCLLAATVPRWDPILMTSGPFINAARFSQRPAGSSLVEWLQRRSRILYYEEGIESTVSVREVGRERLLVINGKTDGSRLGDRRTQLALAHLTLLASASPRRVLVIGLGTGMTAAAAAAHPGVTALEVVEISPEVVAASEYFRPDNRGVLSDHRVRLVRADARNYLLTSRKAYDVIVSEPSNPWITGVANLFTREFFHLASRRLAEGGVMAQWCQSYGLSLEDLRSVLRAFSDVFPHVTVWRPQFGDLVFLGSFQPAAVSLDRLAQLGQTPDGRGQLASIGLEQPAAWARLFLFGDEAVRSFVHRAHANTDDLPRVEFNAPRTLYSETSLDNLLGLLRHLDGRSQQVPFTDVSRRRPEATRVRAFGLDVEVAPDLRVDAHWQVTWTPIIDPSSTMPAIGVSAGRRLIVDTARARFEIECTEETRRSNTARLREALAQRLAETPEEAGASTLASGEPAAWAISPQAIGLAWSCGASGDGFLRCLALAATPAASPSDALDLAARLSCARTADTEGDGEA